MLSWLRKLLSTRGAEAPLFKQHWRQYLEANLPLYSRLPHELQETLHGKIAQLIARVYFEGCGGLELTEEIVVTVAGQACFLVLNRSGPPYPGLRTILVYPSAFRSRVQDVDDLGIVTEETQTRLGESWDGGTVILAWDSVMRGGRNPADGMNVTLHEFAHQLDQELPAFEGTPQLPQPELFAPWTETLREEFEELEERARKGRRSVLDHYGSTNHAEFFAVATESFFEKPRQMRKRHPELYGLLKQCYGVDPESWKVDGKETR